MWTGGLSLLLSLSISPLRAATLNWNGSAGNDWFSAANWTPAQVPTTADDAVIDANTSVLLAGGVPAAFNSLLLGNASGTTSPTLRVTGTISTSGGLTVQRGAVLTFETAQLSTVGQLTVASGGQVTHAANSSARSFIVNLSVAGDFDLQTGGTISVAGKGYEGGTSSNGSGPGAGRGATGFCDSTGGGAGHGGAGGNAATRNLSPGGPGYGSVLDPTDLGSGGGAASDPGCGPNPDGGSGGGAILLTVANTATLNGLMTADGANGGIGAGGGSGGTINVKAGTLAGAGILRANGGTGGGNGGGAGGGRIALTASVASSFSGSVFAAAGAGSNNGGPGVWALKVAPATDYDLVVDGRGVIPSTQTVIPSGLAGVANLTVSTVSLAGGMLSLSNDFILGTRANATFSQLTIGRNFLVPGGAFSGVLTGVVTVQNDVIALSQASGSLLGIVTVQNDVVVQSGATLFASSMSVTRDLVVRSGARLRHPANAATKQHWLKLTIGNDFDLQSGGMVDLVGVGYAGGTSSNGSGPGFGRGATGFCESTGGGAGHGGSGGSATTRNLSAGGAGYDSVLDPSDLGSGGGVGGDPGCSNSVAGGGGGGALVMTVANAVTLDGLITADGANGGIGAGGGSGGTINIKARTIAGAGTMRANGGNSGSGSGGGAGGGRIALTASVANSYIGDISAIAGTGGNNGGPGVSAVKVAPAVDYDVTVNGRGVIPSTHTTFPSGLTGVANLSVSTANLITGSLSLSNDMLLGSRANMTAAQLTVARNLVVQGSATSASLIGVVAVQNDVIVSSSASGSLVGTFSVQRDAVLYGGAVLAASSMSVTRNLTVRPGARLRHPGNGAARQYWLNLTVGNDFDLQPGGMIDLVGVGYAGGTSSNGSGPGAGRGATGFCDSTGGGAGHGGTGGAAGTRNHSAGGVTYGSSSEPIDLGSGGGVGGDPGCSNSVAGGGGGGALVMTVANTLILNGLIAADGANGGVGAGGGSGGTVNVRAGSYAGAGSVSANGGTSVGNWGGGGGGGRLALRGCGVAAVPYSMSGAVPPGGGGAGGAGTVRRATLPSCTEPPLFPAELAVASTGSTPSGGPSLTASWSEDPAATSFTLQVSSDSAFSVDVISVTTAAAPAFVEGLTFRKTYYLRVRATNAFGDSPYSNTLVASVVPSIVDNAVDLFVPDGSTYTLAGIRSYSNSIVVDGALLVAPLSGSTSGFLELSAPMVRVGVNGAISADGAGFPSGQGPGAGYSSSPAPFNDLGGGGGAGYGGLGGVSDRFHTLAGVSYGSVTQPLELGSGGGPSGVPGGRGGGRLKVTAGTIRVDGRVSADGLKGDENIGANFRLAGGGGAGGAVWLSASTLEGSGVIRADGGASVSPDREGGGGGGGRVAATFTSSAFTGTVSARGGIGWQQGGAGTVVYGGELRVENAARGANTLLSGAYTFDSIRVTTNAVVELTSAAAVTAATLIVEGPSLLNLISGALDVQQVSVRSGASLRYAGGSLAATDLAVSSSAILTLNTSISLSQMTVSAGGLVTHESGSTGFDLSVSGSLTVEAGGVISADGAGFAAGQGPGAGQAGGGNQFNNNGGGGGGYGGFGGVARVPLGGPSYGSMMQPLELGSGGGTAHGAGGRGGGRLKIAAGTLRVDGRISANGRDGESSAPEATFKIPSGGGGSGGSVLISASNLQGAGMIAADGGIAPTLYGAGGGGSGGRMAVTYGSTAFTGSLTARGGTGSQAGGAGTIVYGSELRVGNSVQGAITPIPSGTYSFATIRASTGAVVELTSNATVNGSNLFVEGPSLLRLHTGALNVSRIELLPLAEFRYDGGTLTVTDVVVGSSAILTVDTRLKATQLTVRSGGLVTHAAKNAAFELAITNALTVEAGARISADGMGFPADQGVGHGYLGFGSLGGSRGGGGAGYGGLGGIGNNSLTATSGAIYGSLTDPQELGSGGGTVGGAGGAGGGRLKISAGTLRVDGRITADGRDGNREPPDIIISISGGGGSGGAVSIVASEIQGSGSISANGGLAPVAGNRGGGGGGGRIALFYGSRSGAWSVAANGGAGHSSGHTGTIIDNGQVSGLDPAASAGTLASSQMTQRLESSRDLSETITAQLTDFSGAIATGTAPGTFSQADIRLVLVKTGPFAEKGFFRGTWALNLSAITTLTGEWEGMAYLAPDEPRRLVLKGALKGQVRGIIDGTLTESASGSGIFDRLSAACRVVQVDAAAGAGDMFINGSGVQRESAQYPGTALKLLQASLTGQTAGYYSSPLDATLTFLRVNNPGNPYQGEGFFVTSYNSLAGPGSGWAYAVAYEQVARLGGYLDSSLRGLMEGALTLNNPRSLLLVLQNLDIGLPFLAELTTEFTGPSNGNSGTKVTFSVTLRNEGYSAADGVSIVAVYPRGTDFTSASGSYRVYNVVNPAQSFEFPQPFVRWDLPRVEARSSVKVSYQAFVRLPGPGVPGSGEKLGGDFQVITTDWADKVFAGYEDRGAP